MASFFQSFRSSSMPKRLLRYALTRLDLLDSESLDMDNLDLALGKNTVFEFRDVGVKLKKLEKLLRLPDSLTLQKSKVHVLRITIPMDFFTSPIMVEVDGVSVSVRVSGREFSSSPPDGDTTKDSSIVPDPVDLAQEFLKTQPSSERVRLEEALASETQDLGTSVSVSEDGSDEEAPLGTGQSLSLPAFMADFIQGIIDRTQIKIKGVSFQLDVEVPLDPNSPAPELVSFQIALEDIDVEGVTTSSPVLEPESAHVGLKEGKRRVLLNNVRAYLISEANVFSTFAQSPSSPSLCSSPKLTRSSSTHDHGDLLRSHHEDDDQNMSNSQYSVQSESNREYQDSSDRSGSPLGDSELALDIPYDFEEREEENVEDEGPATPRASVYHGLDESLEQSVDQSVFHSTYLPDRRLVNSTAFEADVPQWASTHTEARSEPAYVDALPLDRSIAPETEPTTASPVIDREDRRSSSGSEEDLTQSHLYSREEAESMYLSAFSSDERASLRGSTYSEAPGSHPPAIPATTREAFPEKDDSLQEPDLKDKLDLEIETDSEVEPDTSKGPDLEKKEDPSDEPISTNELESENRPSSTHGSESNTPTRQASPSPLEESVLAESQSDRIQMPGGWDESLDESEIQVEEQTGRTHDSLGEASSSKFFSKTDDNAPPADKSSQFDDNTEQEDVATPKGPPRLVKEIFALDRVFFFVPHGHQHIQVHLDPANEAQQEALSKSGYPLAPGAFSVHGSEKGLQGQVTASHLALGDDKSIEVYLSPVSLRFDTSIGFLLAMVVARLIEALKPQGEAPEPEHGDKSGEPKDNGPNIKVVVEEVSMSFVNHVPGVADTAKRFVDPTAFILDHEVLLNMTLQNIRISRESTYEGVVSKAKKGTVPPTPIVVTKLELEKFRFGYSDDDIISFDKAQPLSMSVRDTFLSAGHDIGIKITQIGTRIRTDIETLPMVVHIDLQRLDETFNWFGGLSSLLQMSSSITSNSPPMASVPSQKAKPRGVRFETPLDPEKQVAPENKTNLRIGSARITLQGKECSLTASSSAIKMVNRDEGVGIAITALRVAGPYLRASKAEPAISIDVGGVRLDFLMTPTDSDLERLLELILPSKVKFDQDNDEIMVDTLLRQRKKGSVLRATLDSVNVRVKHLATLQLLPNLGEELAKLSTVAKYLPEDDRPGLLTLGRVQKMSVALQCDGRLGFFEANLTQLDVGHISIPSLVAVALYGLEVKRNGADEIIDSLDNTMREGHERNPVLMLRIIADEIDSVIKLKLQNLIIEYQVPFIMDILGLEDDATPQDFEAGLAASVANLGDQAQATLRQSEAENEKAPAKKPMGLDIGFRDCVIGLNPLNLQSKMLVALTDARLELDLPQDVEMKVKLGIKKSSILLIDDISAVSSTSARSPSHRRSTSISSRQINEFCALGFVNVCFISSAQVLVDVKPGVELERQIDIEVRDDLLVLETCADSTQTLITLVNALKPPTPPSKEEKYRFKVMPVEDLLSSISAEAFGNTEGDYDFDQDFAAAQEMAGSSSEAEFGSDQSLNIDTQYYGDEYKGEELFDAMKSSQMSDGTTMHDTAEGVLLTGFNPESSTTSDSGDELVIHENYYGEESKSNSTAQIWNSTKGTYDKASPQLVKRSPIRISAKDVHFIWHLFDGYDWAHTRDVISQAVQSVEDRALQFQTNRDGFDIHEEELEEEETIGDFLFNSIYIGIPASRQLGDLTQAINQELNNDNATETESIATTAFTDASNRTARPHQTRKKRLRLNRSKHHKMSFELQGINADIVVYPEDAGETQSSIDVRVNSLDIFDHVPTSTWRKFATYDRDTGEREMGTSMLHLEILNVKPMPELVASESVLRVTVLPLRLHVDQDALDFLTRFFEFKDEKVPVHASPSDIPFVQRAEINSIPVKLDFKPKRVDYAGLRSGRTTEFMNFIVMDEARLVLRHVIIYGISGFDRLGKTLNDIWMPDVKSNQLPGVLAGLAPVRSLVNIGSGFKDLVEIPIREYQKDGRVLRSISKGAAAFAKTTGTEIVKLGAKIAVGTQYALQGAEDMLTQQNQGAGSSWEDDDADPDDKKQISLYADQPPSVVQGLRGGYRSLARDLNVARDAIIAVPGEVMQSQSPGGAARAVLKRTPTIIFRPAMGVSKAIGQTLLGATNALDSQHQRRIDEKYKKH
ncbi:unnamed protein product [Clonostachys chloroleuca]|uniref:Autophagy-related protein 2 n=1 Tax=Clonostachys chloroleuca TaxID=1926264 RepID=A0AA35MIZ0_9HYPO|nr:unnamed protein product [Clonostachys chloroleuca]